MKYTEDKKVTKQVVSAKKAMAATWKQCTAQLNDKQTLTIGKGKNAQTCSAHEAWNILDTPSSKSGVVKATDIKKAWYAGFTSEGTVDKREYFVRKKAAVKVCIAEKDYALYKEEAKSTAVKVWEWKSMKNANDPTFDKSTDVKVTADLILQGLYDSKYFADTKKEVEDSVSEANKLTEGYINMGDNDHTNWVHVAKTDNGNWVISEKKVVAPINLNAKTA